MNTKPGQSKGKEENIALTKGVDTVLIAVNALKDKGLNTLSATRQIQFTTCAVAKALAHRVADVTLEEKPHMFYQTNVVPHLENVLNKVNEKVVLDTTAVLDLTYRLWLGRAYIVTGINTPWNTRNLKDLMPDDQAHMYHEYLEFNGDI